MAFSLEKLRSLSDEELIRMHDETARNTSIGLNYFLEEIARREQSRQTEAMLAYTKSMRNYTIWISVMTIIILIASVLQLFKHN